MSESAKAKYLRAALRIFAAVSHTLPRCEPRANSPVHDTAQAASKFWRWCRRCSRIARVHCFRNAFRYLNVNPKDLNRAQLRKDSEGTRASLDGRCIFRGRRQAQSAPDGDPCSVGRRSTASGHENARREEGLAPAMPANRCGIVLAVRTADTHE